MVISNECKIKRKKKTVLVSTDHNQYYFTKRPNFSGIGIVYKTIVIYPCLWPETISSSIPVTLVRISFIARYVYTYEEFVFVTEATAVQQNDSDRTKKHRLKKKTVLYLQVYYVQLKCRLRMCVR